MVVAFLCGRMFIPDPLTESVDILGAKNKPDLLTAMEQLGRFSSVKTLRAINIGAIYGLDQPRLIQNSLAHLPAPVCQLDGPFQLLQRGVEMG